MPPADLNVVKRSGKYVYLNAHWKKTQRSCPGSRDLNWTGKGLIRSWRPFITWNVHKLKLLWSRGVLFNNIYKKTQLNSREGMANLSSDVYWAKVTQQLTLYCRYSQLVANRCCRLACSLLETPFVTRDFFCSENLFVMRGVHELRLYCSLSWPFFL
jgi:hypothetical protein